MPERSPHAPPLAEEEWSSLEAEARVLLAGMEERAGPTFEDLIEETMATIWLYHAVDRAGASSEEHRRVRQTERDLSTDRWALARHLLADFHRDRRLEALALEIGPHTFARER